MVQQEGLAKSTAVATTAITNSAAAARSKDDRVALIRNIPRKNSMMPPSTATTMINDEIDDNDFNNNNDTDKPAIVQSESRKDLYLISQDCRNGDSHFMVRGHIDNEDLNDVVDSTSIKVTGGSGSSSEIQLTISNQSMQLILK